MYLFGTDLQINAIVIYCADYNYVESCFLDENGFNLESHDDDLLEERLLCIRFILQREKLQSKHTSVT
jgi:hypothetical protein